MSTEMENGTDILWIVLCLLKICSLVELTEVTSL